MTIKIGSTENKIRLCQKIHRIMIFYYLQSAGKNDTIYCISESLKEGFGNIFNSIFIGSVSLVSSKTNRSRNGMGKRVLSVSLAAALAAAAFGGIGAYALSDADSASNGYELAESIQEGTILHCFDWKYTDITAELENIAKAGFTSVQTSPVQPSEGTGPWYWLYQPLGFYVDTNDLGTKEELKELCDEAEKYGINVIVDVVANHLADNHDNIQEDLKADEYWHDYGAVSNYNNREEVTQGDIGMVDLNSENEYVQKVVADYIEELKELGVDGIRWDAAKHIALPSEGCEFWPAVTASGLYNYGEILTGPVDNGGEELMAEYTEYLSVTDDSYGNALLSAFRKGQAPAASGNWSERGIDADKLVYWGESHDTYSNGEGEGSNGATQNEVDRAYAVAASRNDIAALYFSRPEAVAKDSIRSGVKGSLHFTSPEVAAVNHFHNAMAGLEDYYTTDNNSAVITRKDGGAVIVLGEGSGDVSVVNGGGYAKSGTYKDEITGNEFVITADTITGTVGESGIAVIYDSDFTSRVEASVETGTTFNGTLKVALKAIDVTDAAYVTSEGDSGAYNDGDEIEIGAKTESGDITVTLTAKKADGTEVSAEYKYTKLADRNLPVISDGGIVFDNSQTGWDAVNIYVYDESGKTTITNGEWPGVEMTAGEDDYYSYQLPEQFAECEHIMVIFNNGAGDQIPGAMQAGMTMAYTDKKLYDGNKWIDYPETVQPPVDPTDDPKGDPEKPSDSGNDPSDTGKPSDNGSSGQSDNNSNNNNSNNNNGNANTVNEQSDTSTPAEGTVATSDNTPLYAVMMVCVVSAAAAIFMIARKKREQ